MILGVDKLLELVRKKKLVENLSERELKNPEGAGFDLRIGELYEVKGRGFLGVDERKTPKIKLLAKYNKKKLNKVILQPKTYYLMKTVEKLNMLSNLLALFTPRSTLYRSGIYIFGGQTAPGYKGELTTGIYNFRDEKFELEIGSRVLHIMFFETKGESNLYRGQWQGGRVATKKKEKQVWKKSLRELNEEVEFDRHDVQKTQPLGAILSSADLVSQEHLGIVLGFKMATRNVKVRAEGELARGCFLTFFEFLIWGDWIDFLLSIHTPEEVEHFLRKDRKLGE